MPQLTVDIFQTAADRFDLAQVEAMKEWRPTCGCEAPGLRLECRDCVDNQQLRLLIQMKLNPQPETVFPAVLLPPTKQPYSPEIRQKVVSMYAEGHSIEAIQRETGATSRQLIRKWARQAGHAPRIVFYPETIREHCLKLYQVGKRPQEIERLTGVPADTIGGWANAAGVIKNRHYPETLRKQCLSFYLQGHTPREIETILSIPAGTIRKWVSRAGLQRGSGRPRQYPDDLREQCLLMSNAGKGFREIESLTGVSEATVRGWKKQQERRAAQNTKQREEL